MKTPLLDGLKRYIEENNVRFHMPGHKGKMGRVNYGSLIPEIDVTEVEGTDNLHKPSSIIKNSQTLAAKAFGAKRTFFSVNGTTGGLYSAIMGLTTPGDKILIQRNSHRAIYNALILGDLNPVYIYPKYDEENHMVMGICPYEMEKILSRDAGIKVVVITNPSYYGICSNIKKLAEIVHNYHKLLIIDEAHGSHFIFSDKLPMAALSAGADVVVQSTHKTLPALTQSSMIHVGTDRVNIKKLQEFVSMHQTTSPSYILMASLEEARDYMETEGEIRLEKVIEAIHQGKGYLRGIEGVKVLDQSSSLSPTFYDFDNTKLLINLTGINISGKRLEAILRKDYKIQLEMADNYYGVALISVMDDKEDIKKLTYAVENIVAKKDYREKFLKETSIREIIPEMSIRLKEAFYRDKENLSLKKSQGRISGDFIIPYPPGIPILCPGEKITEEMINYIHELKDQNIQLLGLSDDSRIQIIK